MDVWLWISELPNSPDWATSTSPLVYPLATSNPTHDKPAQLIQLRADRVTSISGSDTGKWVTFSIHLQGFEAHTKLRSTLWISDTCPLTSDKPFLPLVLQLLQEILNHSPSSPDSTVSQLPNLKPDPVSWIMETHSPESFSVFFALLFLTRLFWLCAFDAPSAVGSLYFNSFLEPNLELLARESHAPIMRASLLASGVDVERCLARAVGYMLVKCLILREMRVGGFKSLAPPRYNLGLSYATEAHGMWQLKSYAPVWSMSPTRPGASKNPLLVEARESALRYSLAHQQLESVIQLVYSLEFCEDHIQVRARVDNLRFHVVKLGFNNRNGNEGEEVEYGEETYFPSRIRVWIGPESGSNYVTSLSLGKSTGNMKREVEVQRIAKGNLGKMKAPRIKVTSRTLTRMKMKDWRWDQDAEGNTALYDGILSDTTSGVEVYAMVLSDKGGGVGDCELIRRRYAGGNRAFTKSKGLIIKGDECGEEVRWRVRKEVEGSVLKWRVGGKVWVSYFPSQDNSSYCETRCLEWCDEVDLPLMMPTI